jgi:rubrerythrin
MQEHDHNDQTTRRPALDELKHDPSSRKRFLKMAGGGAVASAFALFVAACGDDEEESGAGGGTSDTQAKTMAGKGGDLEIVNYALTLEYLEADFYEQVVESGAITDKKIVSLAKEIGESEQAHVDALLATAKSLGKPAARPKTDFTAVLEGGPEKILQTAATVENLGAAAYLGQAGRIQDKEILAAALSIHSVEARHAAALNALVGRGFTGDGPLEGSIPDGAFAMPMTMDQVLREVQPFLA